VNDGVVAGCYLVTLREVVTYLPINYSLLSVPTALMIFTRTRWEKKCDFRHSTTCIPQCSAFL